MINSDIQKNRKTILIVDDSMVARRMVRFALHGLDCEMLEATNGNEAVRVLHSRSIDLMVTDSNVPSLNGFELSRIIRETPGMEDMPIIMLSQGDTAEQKDEARRNGISLFISKPFTPEHFFGLVKQVLR